MSLEFWCFYTLNLPGAQSKVAENFSRDFKTKYRDIVNVPWCIQNKDIHRDLNIASPETKFINLPVNVCLSIKMSRCTKMFDITELVRRVNRMKPFDMM